MPLESWQDFGGPEQVQRGSFAAFYSLCHLVAAPLHRSLTVSSSAFQYRLSGIQQFLSTKAQLAASCGYDFLVAMQFVDFLAALPKTPYIYPRQFALPHMHTKFIEQHYALLDQLLSCCLPIQRQLYYVETASAKTDNTAHTSPLDPQVTAESKTSDMTDENEEPSSLEALAYSDLSGKPWQRFILRWGFKQKSELVRIRSLDPERIFWLDPQQGFANLSARQSELYVELERLDDWGELKELKHIIICENEICYLSLPQISHSIAIWGSGYKASILGRLNLLNKVDVVYWGDLDTHGFAILNQLRASLAAHQSSKDGVVKKDSTELPCVDQALGVSARAVYTGPVDTQRHVIGHRLSVNMPAHESLAYSAVRSMLMDCEALENNLSLKVEEKRPFNGKLALLTEQEQTAYQALLNHVYGQQVRIEQELIPFDQVIAALRVLLPQEQVVAPDFYC